MGNLCRPQSAPPPPAPPPVREMPVRDLDIPDLLGQCVEPAESCDQRALVDMHDSKHTGWRTRTDRVEWARGTLDRSIRTPILRMDLSHSSSLRVSNNFGNVASGCQIEASDGRARTSGASVSASVDVTPGSILNGSVSAEVAAKFEQRVGAGNQSVNLVYTRPKVKVEIKRPGDVASDSPFVSAVVMGCSLIVTLTVVQDAGNSADRSANLGVTVGAGAAVGVTAATGRTATHSGKQFNVTFEAKGGQDLAASQLQSKTFDEVIAYVEEHWLGEGASTRLSPIREAAKSEQVNPRGWQALAVGVHDCDVSCGNQYTHTRTHAHAHAHAHM